MATPFLTKVNKCVILKVRMESFSSKYTSGLSASFLLTFKVWQKKAMAWSNCTSDLGGGYFKEEQIQYQRNLTLLFLDCGSHQHCVPELSRAAWAVGPVKTGVDPAHMLFSWTRRKELSRWPWVSSALQYTLHIHTKWFQNLNANTCNSEAHSDVRMDSQANFYWLLQL